MVPLKSMVTRSPAWAARSAWLKRVRCLRRMSMVLSISASGHIAGGLGDFLARQITHGDFRVDFEHGGK